MSDGKLDKVLQRILFASLIILAWLFIFATVLSLVTRLSGE